MVSRVRNPIPVGKAVVGGSELRQSHGKAAAPSLMQIAGVFARYGNFTLGGGSATTAVIHGEIVEKRHWVDDPKFALSYALGRVTPGTNLLAFCTAIGWLLRRLPGALVALVVASIPCALMVVVVTAMFSRLQESSVAQAAIHGAVAAAVGITVKSCWTIAGPYFKGAARPQVALIAAVAFVLHAYVALPAIDVLLLAAAVGFLLPPARP
jgi:chromate transporter